MKIRYSKCFIAKKTSLNKLVAAKILFNLFVV